MILMTVQNAFAFVQRLHLKFTISFLLIIWYVASEAVTWCPHGIWDARC